MKRYVTITEVAKLAEISEPTVRRLYHRGEFAKEVPSGELPYRRRGNGVTSKVWIHREVAKAIRDAYLVPA